MNVFHWHLSEDQGFRVESKKFPKLQEMGSDGLYYTQAEVRELIAYAYDRGIRVVPEFDMPGHSTAWFVGYPELASGSGPYEIERKWGVFDPAMDPPAKKPINFSTLLSERWQHSFLTSISCRRDKLTARNGIPIRRFRNSCMHTE